MEEKIISYYELIDKIKNEKKKSDIVFFISTGCIPIAILGAIYIESFYIISIMFAIFYIFLLFLFIFRNINFDKRINELEMMRNEIDNYCVEIGKNIYITTDNLMILDGNKTKNSIIRLDNIKSVNRVYGDGDSSIRIETKDKKVYLIYYDENMLNRIQTKNVPKTKKVESELVKNFILYDDYATGTIYVPGLKMESEIYVYKNDEHTIEYAETTAKKIKEYTYKDFSDAIECSVWSYYAYLKEHGYDEFLYKNNRITVDVSKNNILNYMTLVNVASETDGIVLQFEVPWDEEHGFSWVFKNKELIYVGSGHDVYPTSNDKVLNGFWNYAKKYHKEVFLSSEEKLKLEEAYKQVEKNESTIK